MLSVKDIHDMTSRAVLANCNNLTRHPSANVVWMWSLLLIVNWYGAVFYVFYFPESSSNRHHHSAGMRKCCTINLKKLGVSIHSQLATYVKSTSHWRHTIPAAYIDHLPSIAFSALSSSGRLGWLRLWKSCWCGEWCAWCARMWFKLIFIAACVVQNSSNAMTVTSSKRVLIAGTEQLADSQWVRRAGYQSLYFPPKMTWWYSMVVTVADIRTKTLKSY